MVLNIVSTEDVLAEMKNSVAITMEQEYKPYYPESLPLMNQSLVRVGEWPLYRSDAIVRNAKELQLCAAADSACIRINPTNSR